ncbi:hypothetical protein Pelo_18762 [Pelomyxa schiedti]|nr:hypothetical protein Pelo_18762 [Pelomyxa schiedti]
MSEVDEKPVLVVVAYNKITAEGFKEAQSTNNDETMARISKIPNWPADVQNEVCTLQKEVHFKLTPRQWLDVFCVVGSLVCSILIRFGLNLGICQGFQVWAETLTRELAIEQEFHAAGRPKMLEVIHSYLINTEESGSCNQC